MNLKMKELFGEDPQKPGSMLDVDVDSCKLALQYVLQDVILVRMKNHMKNKITRDLDKKQFDSCHMYEIQDRAMMDYIFKKVVRL